MRPGSEIPPGVASDCVFTSTVMIAAGYAEADDSGDAFVWSCGMSWVGGEWQAVSAVSGASSRFVWVSVDKEPELTGV